MHHRPEVTGRKGGSDPPGKRLPSTMVCERYGINRRTLGRWMVDENLGFPEPVTINGRHYFDENKLDAWERSRAIASVGRAA